MKIRNLISTLQCILNVYGVFPIYFRETWGPSAPPGCGKSLLAVTFLLKIETWGERDVGGDVGTVLAFQFPNKRGTSCKKNPTTSIILGFSVMHQRKREGLLFSFVKLIC
jgi:hypothetical protein